jgi:hypothetical protein
MLGDSSWPEFPGKAIHGVSEEENKVVDGV